MQNIGISAWSWGGVKQRANVSALADKPTRRSGHVGDCQHCSGSNGPAVRTVNDAPVARRAGGRSPSFPG